MPKYRKIDTRVETFDQIMGAHARKTQARTIALQRTQARRLREAEQTESLLAHEFSFGHTSKYEG